MAICGRCHAQNPDEMAFCRHCGAPLPTQNAANGRQRNPVPGAQPGRSPYDRTMAGRGSDPAPGNANYAQGNRAPGAAVGNRYEPRNAPAGPQGYPPTPQAANRNPGPNRNPNYGYGSPVPGQQTNIPAPGAGVQTGRAGIALPAFLAGIPVAPVAVSLIALLVNIILHFIPMVKMVDYKTNGTYSMFGVARMLAKEGSEGAAMSSMLKAPMIFFVILIAVSMAFIVLPIFTHRGYSTGNFIPAIVAVVLSFCAQMFMVFVCLAAGSQDHHDGASASLQFGGFLFIIDTIATVIILIICAKKAKAASQVRGPMNPPMMNDSLMSGGMDQRWS
ncbi:MAG: zinc-ribbon domain-containing protein [Clostridia bacterium]|nr:zinc-ribbon domain-containing protein [Clostridia bacterium]